MPGRGLHRAWQICVSLTLAAGLFHLVNLVEPGRIALGPALITPFRLAFVLSWALLLVQIVRERLMPRLDAADALVAGVALVFLLRGICTPETLGITLNWIVTGAGIFFLVKHGARGPGDIRLIIAVAAVSALGLSAAGLAEYAAKQNPLFESIQIEAIGMDARVEASDQFYRVRSLIGHPGFVGAVLTAAAPLVLLSFWRRRALSALALIALATVIFLTFSRGSWLLAALVLAPAFIFRGRSWLRRRWRWLAPALILPVALIAIDYTRLEQTSVELGEQNRPDGLNWLKGKDGPYRLPETGAGGSGGGAGSGGGTRGVIPMNRFLYFDVDDGFFHEEEGTVTVLVRFLDTGTGAIHLEYDSWNQEADKGGLYALSGYINKTDTGQWSTVAFYLKDPRFAGRQNGGADFRVVDDESSAAIDRVVVQKGRLKLPTIIAQQLLSRSGSVSTRAALYPMAWSVLMENPLGVGLYNSPGTDHHAVDSVPLTWMMEFGWLAAPLIVLLLAVFIREGVLVFKGRGGPAVVLYLSMALLLIHGGHLMVIYDKPSLVLLGAVGAVYALIRPWRPGGPVIKVDKHGCML